LSANFGARAGIGYPGSMRDADDDRVLRPLRQVARHLGLGERVIYNARDRGELDTFQISNRTYMRMRDARAWLERHRRSARSAATE
jgi:hypothetical protein